jgi:glucan 1,3-beta-glucosidase
MNPNQPIPMLKVGNPGEMGVAQLSNFLISTYGPQPGAQLIEWNMHDPLNQPGSCGMWDVHFRIGGAISTKIEPSNCPRGDGSTAPASECTGAWGLLHLTPTSSCYLENVWGWVADHDIDQKSQINVYNSRGFLCESQGPVWLYGTSFEHSLYYQYNFHNARNVFMGMIQTETPYFQPSSNTPFSPIDFRDPKFCTDDSRCNMAFALVIDESSEIYMYGAGFYSFFNHWSQDCLTGIPKCQKDLVKITDSRRVYMYNLNTYGSVYMLTSNEPYSASVENNNTTFCAISVVNLNFF